MTHQQRGMDETVTPQAGVVGGSVLQELQQHRTALLLRRNAIRTHLQLLEEQKDAAPQKNAARLNEIGVLRHQEMAATLDIEATSEKIALVDRVSRLQSTVAVQSASDPLVGRRQIEEAGYGVFLLMIPIVFALARRIWLRSSGGARLGADLESSPRLRRMEEGIEAIALEVERIGEAQRFAAKLLAERPTEPANRPTPAASPAVRRVPGTITPH